MTSRQFAGEIRKWNVKPGDDLESERYLITVEEAKAAGSSAVKLDGTREALESGPRPFISSSRYLGCQPSGLKRKATGFQRPYKAPKQVTVTENGESAASSGDWKAGPTFPAPFSSTLPLFSTVGQKAMSPTLADKENTVTFRSRERRDSPFSLASSSFSVSPDTLSNEDKFCSPIPSENQHSDSLLASESMRRNNLEFHCPGVSQNLRSKAQILALLKSKSTNVSKDLTCEITECFPKIQPQGCPKITSKPEEEYAVRKSSASLRCELLQAENPTRAASRWTVYLPSQSSPPCSPRDENDTEDKLAAQENINLSELSVAKKTELFKTCAEKGELHSQDKSGDSNCQYWNHEENLGAPSFCENNNLLVSCSSKENVRLLLEPDIQNNSKVPSNQNDKVCMEGLLCTGGSIQVADADADAAVHQEYMSCSSVSPLPEIEHNQIEVESSLSKNSRISEGIADMGSNSNADRESLDTIRNPSQFLEVSFDLSNFETSDTDEASLEDNKLSQDSESREKDILLTDDSCVQKNCGDIGCQEIARQPLPLLPFASGRPKEILPANEALLSEFCDRTCVGFYAGLHEDANTGKAVQEQCGDTGSSSDSSQGCNEDVLVDSKEDANTSIHRDGISYGIVSPSNKPKGLKNSGFLESKNLQRFPFASRASDPFIALLPDDSCSFVTDDDVRESVLNLCEESVLSLNLGPKDQGETSSWEGSREGTPGDVSLLHKNSTQSKWLKYQNTFQCNSAALNRIDSEVTEGVFAEDVSGMQSSHTSERWGDAVTESSVDHVHLQMMKGMLYQQQQDFSSQDLLPRKRPLSLNSRHTSKTEEIQAMLGSSASYNSRVKDLEEINGSELCFPSGQKIISAYLPQRQVHIPAVFQSPIHYKQTFTSSIIEHLNILLFGLAQRLYKALSKVDMSFYISSKGETLKSGKNNSLSCHHNQAAKLVMVKREGPNKGRLFYTCDRPKGNQCKFFKWLEEATPGQLSQDESQPNMVFNDVKSIGSYLRSQKVPVYEECQLLLRKGFDLQRKQYGKLKKFATVNPEFNSETKSKIYLKLSRKESSSTYSKGDLWVISKTLDFKLDTFIACSVFFGPSSVNEVELLPLKGYFPSNWPINACPFPCMNDLKFPVVVLDECSQMTEPASLLPIARFESEKLILVGDPKQLPPTIQGSDAAHENGLEQTLFDRLCLMGHKPVVLRTQYRCHPVISAIANDLFYEGNLMNGISETERSPVVEWLPTLCFYNVTGAEQVERENSFQNVAEAAFTLKLIQSLIASGIAGSMIGVITLYKSQMYKICHLLSAMDFNHPEAKAVQVSTVDAFQGAEKEIIILSCVRTRQVGFIDSEKRMNVALTRSRRHLLIVGSLSCLRKNRLWERVIQHCEGIIRPIWYFEWMIITFLNNMVPSDRTPRGSAGKSTSFYSPYESAGWVPHIFSGCSRWRLQKGVASVPAGLVECDRGRRRTAKSRQGEPRPRLLAALLLLSLAVEAQVWPEGRTSPRRPGLQEPLFTAGRWRKARCCVIKASSARTAPRRE
ncbi:zinc finger GRF-type containing 1 [Cricetulus griseus]